MLGSVAYLGRYATKKNSNFDLTSSRFLLLKKNEMENIFSSILIWYIHKISQQMTLKFGNGNMKHV